MSKSRDLGEFPAAALDIDASGNLDVTGTVTADGLTVEAGTTSKITVSESTGSGTASIDFVATSSFPKTKIVTDISGGSLALETLGSERLKIANNGDISFYEDTGTTPKFFWDASAENLGIGTSSPTTTLDVNGSIRSGAVSVDGGSNRYMYITSSDGAGECELRLGDVADTDAGSIAYNNGSDSLQFRAGAAERLRINSAGNLGIGTSSVTAAIQVAKGTTVNGGPAPGYASGSACFGNDTSGSAYGLVMGAAGTGAGYISAQRTDGTAQTYPLHLQPNGGNVGIGTNSPSSALEVVGGSSLGSGFTQSRSGHPTFGITNGGTDSVYFSIAPDGGSQQAFMQVRDDNTDVDSIALSTSGSERVRIDSAGNVGIGTSLPAAKLHLASGSALEQRIVHEGNGTTVIRRDGSTSYLLSESGGATSRNLAFGYQTSSGSAITETMRIDSSGHLLVSKTSPGDFTPGFEVQPTGTMLAYRTGGLAGIFGRSNNGELIRFNENVTQVGSISITGNSTAYNTSSDYRLKEDDVPMTGATERVKALRPINFAWKTDGSRVDGFFAHEVQEVVPEAATGAKDAMMDEEYEVTPAAYEDVTTPAVEAVLDEDGVVITEAVEESTESVLVTEAVMATRSVPDYQGIDQSKLVPLLTATIQELIARIEILEAK